MQSTKCLWLTGLSPKTRLGDIESELLRVLRASRMDRKRIEVRYNPKECNFALIQFDSLRESELCRNEFRGRVFPDTTERVKCDYYEPRKFKYYPGSTAAAAAAAASSNAKRKQSRSRSNSRGTANPTSAQRDTSDHERER